MPSTSRRATPPRKISGERGPVKNRTGHTPTVVFIAPPSAEGAATRSLQRALSAVGFAWADGEQEYDALVVAGGLDIRAFVDSEGEIVGAVADAIANAHAAGKWIGAPCVASALALRALEPAVRSGAATERRVRDGVAVFPGLRLVGTDRPLFGYDEAERNAIVAEFAVVMAVNAGARAP